MLKIKDLLLKNNLISAPMAGISDMVYRSIIKEHGAGLVCSEMISATALKYQPNPRFILSVAESEHPISIQLFGSNPDDFGQAVKRVEAAGADVIDLNAGCPVPKVMKQQAGAYLLKTPQVMASIIASMRKATNLPISVKIRSGWDMSSINVVDTARLVEQEGADAIIVHPRTRSQGYTGNADWELIRRVKDTVSIPVIGNGDITGPQSARQMLERTGCEGLMIGRAAIGNPWIFRDTLSYLSSGTTPAPVPLADKMQLAFDHASRLSLFKGEKIALKEMRKFLVKYFSGIPHAAFYRTRLSLVNTLDDLSLIIDEIKKQQVELSLS